MDVPITLPNKTYTITIQEASLGQVGNWLANLWSTDKKVAIITDTVVSDFYLAQVKDALADSGFNVCYKILPSGEGTKSLETTSEVMAWLTSEGLTRSDGLLALGGGIIGDLAGFVASTYMRGIDFVQLPTSLLAQVDSSVGGKTAVNCHGIKNLVGTFYQPDGVLIDPLTLGTLPSERVSEGLAEVVKMAAILDSELWHDLDQLTSVEDFLKNPTPFIARSCYLKGMIVESDEKEKGKRLLLNFGHTLAHGIEGTVLPPIAHGQAVAIGMYQLSKVLVEKGHTPADALWHLGEMLKKFNLPVTMPPLSFELFFQSLKSDKKNRGQDIKLVYLEAIGKSEILTMPLKELEETLRKEFST